MKSHESDQVVLASHIYHDAIARCVAIEPDLRDLMTIKSRVEKEGLSFLTITLPSFGKDFEHSLSNGGIDSTCFRSFKKHGAIPAFLQGMLSRIFDQVTGRILHEKHQDISCVEAARQIAYSFKKLEIDCTPERVQSALDSFTELEHELSEAVLQDDDVAWFRDVASTLWDSLSRIDLRDSLPKHGPGATAERTIGSNQKYVWQRWHDRLEPFFPLLSSAYTISAYGSREFEDVTIILEEQEAPVRVSPVPKTQKGPRIIAIEPCCMQYAQQSIRQILYRSVERNYFSAGHVNFTDQSINRQLAMVASRDESFSTLDLSEASDRVLSTLALDMFNCNPDLRDAIEACRTTKAQLPDGTIIGPLKKFASMGSALCFPVESMYFYTICIVALLREQHLPVTPRNIYSVSRGVYIYGDDIIINHKWATTVVDYLHKYHCKVNMSKSFWTGKFRESCGMDAYNGHDVTPTYVRRLHPDNRRQADRLVSWIKTANLFERKGYAATSAYMFRVCERYLGKLPIISETSPALGRILQQPLTTQRWNNGLHRSEIRAWVAEPVYHTDKLEGYGALMKCLMSLERAPILRNFLRDEIPSMDKKHLERSARHGAVALKRRWVAA